MPAVSPSPTSLQIPASIGEVVDKITILELKAARLSGERLTNVERERHLPVGCLEAEGLAVADDLFDALRQINAKLWAIEDDIRALEAKQDFGEDYPEAGFRIWASRSSPLSAATTEPGLEALA